MNKGATSLPRYSRHFFARRSEDTGFVRDTLEKVHRLVDILEYFNRNPLLRKRSPERGHSDQPHNIQPATPLCRY